jgi:hypothetical protein
MTSVTQLGALGLSVSNVDDWERFASQILVLQRNGRDADGSLFLRMDEYHYRFIVHPTGKNDLAYIGWEVATEEALHARRPGSPRPASPCNRVCRRRLRRDGWRGS